jgi:hypothetical protein
MTFTYLKGNCPVCNGARKDCRQSNSLIHCRDTQASPSSFHCIGEDSLGFLLWTENSGNSDDWQNRLELREQRRREREQAKREQNQRVLSTKDRDRQFRSIARHSGLKQFHRAKLADRNLSDSQIQLAYQHGLLWSWASGADIPNTTSLLPGVDAQGRLRHYASGFAIAVPDADGKILGCQIRGDDPNAKYIWASSDKIGGNGPHMPNGELPISFYRPLEGSASGAINLAEGHLKPFIIAQRYGVICIGASGGNFVSSPQLLKIYLERASAELGTKHVVLNADASAVANPQVIEQYRKVWERAQAWGYQVFIRWWEQVEKSVGDADEISTDVFNAAKLLTVAEFEAICSVYCPDESKAGTQQFLDRIAQQFDRAATKCFKGFSKLSKQPRLSPKSSQNGVYFYEEGNRIATWQSAAKTGYKYILDQSGTGTGKSHDAGMVQPELFSLEQFIYLSEQHRNPTTDSLKPGKGWVDLESRHSGLTREQTVDGGSRLRRASKGEKPSIPANCNRTALITTLREKNVNGADTAALICGSCPLREACSHAEGPGYGFLNQRRSALSLLLLRAHPDSAPDPLDYDYDGVGLIWEEFGEAFNVKKVVNISLRDIEQVLIALLPYPDLSQSLQPLLKALLPYVDGSEKLPRYGLNHPELAQRLPLPSVDFDRLQQAIGTKLQFINSTAEDYGVDLADLPPSLRKRFAERDSQLAELAEQQVIKQWLPDLLHVLSGDIPGASIRIDHNGLHLTLPDQRHRTIARAAKVNIILDATLSREDLALKLDCKPEEIFVCTQQSDQPNNLMITQVADLGRMGMQRGKDQERRLAATVAHCKALDPTTKLIDFKGNGGDGAWWRDSRGVNDFLQVKTLILAGTPCRNLADLQAEYAVLTGQFPSQEDACFKAWVDRIISSDIHQAIGRLRANRRPDEQLQVVLISDFPLDIPVQQVSAADITIEAAGKTERIILATRQAIQQLTQQGVKATQEAIAKLVGVSQARISQLWNFINFAIEESNSRIYKPVDEAEAQKIKDLGQILETVVAHPGLAERAEGIAEMFLDWLNPIEYRQVWGELTQRAQVNLLEMILLTLPPSMFEQLCEISKWEEPKDGNS